jgi:hypothetical protein
MKMHKQMDQQMQMQAQMNAAPPPPPDNKKPPSKAGVQMGANDESQPTIQ